VFVDAAHHQVLLMDKEEVEQLRAEYLADDEQLEGKADKGKKEVMEEQDSKAAVAGSGSGSGASTAAGGGQAVHGLGGAALTGMLVAGVGHPVHTHVISMGPSPSRVCGLHLTIVTM
jgi:hypothetical protein